MNHVFKKFSFLNFLIIDFFSFNLAPNNWNLASIYKQMCDYHLCLAIWREPSAPENQKRKCVLRHSMYPSINRVDSTHSVSFWNFLLPIKIVNYKTNFLQFQLVLFINLFFSWHYEVSNRWHIAAVIRDATTVWGISDNPDVTVFTPIGT